ncbi:MAG: nicotinamide mononucleotide transporter [Clostridia bacterium]|nr:nicotinamide mononucleotide transporter [Clostridia bacterium]
MLKLKKREWLLLAISVISIAVSFFIFDGKNYFTLVASIVGAVSLIFNAKGNPTGQILMIVFSVMYGIISYACAYYGEMITYLGMTLPMAAFALVAWLRHPHNGNRAEVEVNTLKTRELIFAFFLTMLVTSAFYFILKALGTANLLPSTISVATSFAAAYLTFRRSPYFALAYAMNDAVLIVLWIMANINYGGYISVIVCFIVFFVNDLYGFINWLIMRSAQRTTKR